MKRRPILDRDVTLDELQEILEQVWCNLNSNGFGECVSRDTFEHRQACYDELSQLVRTRGRFADRAWVSATEAPITRTAAVNEILSHCDPRPYLQTVRAQPMRGKPKEYRVRWCKAARDTQVDTLSRTSAILRKAVDRLTAPVKADALSGQVEFSIADDIENLIESRRRYDAIAARELVHQLKEGRIVDLVPLRQAIKEMVAAKDVGDKDALLFQDTEFHAQIAAVAGLSDVANRIRQNRAGLRYYRFRLLLREKNAQLLIEEHRQILAAIERRDINAVDKFVVQHLNDESRELDWQL